jgi:colanic acid biosynthesis glycosyl transferase WcaI
VKILLLTQLFQPEPNHLKGLAFTQQLIARGHDVEVLTGFPNYPGGKVYDGYRIRLVQKETIEGVPVTRVAMYPSHDGSTFRRLLTYVSFALSAAAAGIFLYRRFDIVHVYQGPAILVLSGALLAFTTRAKLIVDIQDIWPESVSSSGMLRNRLLLGLVRKLAEVTYRLADEIIVLSNGYKDLIAARGAAGSKIHVIYNWCDESAGAEGETDDRLCGMKTAGGSIIMYAGTMGRVQALQSVIDAAELVQSTHPAVQFAFIGGGIEAGSLREYAAAKQLTNVSFFPMVDPRRMRSVLSAADVLLIHMRKDALGAVGIPQKTQAYLAAGKPIIMAVDGEAAAIVQDAHAGVVCTPEDPASIAAAARDVCAMSAAQREELGRNGQRYYRGRMSFAAGLTNIVSVYHSALHT